MEERELPSGVLEDISRIGDIADPITRYNRVVEFQWAHVGENYDLAVRTLVSELKKRGYTDKYLG